MILAKAPLRINFLGGGSDFPEVFRNQGGAVFGCSVNLYVYLMAALIPPFAQENFRFTYRKSESVMKVEDFEHPVVRQILMEKKWVPSLNLATMSDVPGNSGLGSSSAFTVVLIKLLEELNATKMSKMDVAKEAIRIERLELLEPGGWQDQLHASFGGFNGFIFNSDNSIEVLPIPEVEPIVQLINKSMLLIPFGELRLSSQFSDQYKNGLKNATYLSLIKENSDVAKKVSEQFQDSKISDDEKLALLGKAMKRAWQIKLETSPFSELGKANALIKKGIQAGALAGKLCGAGQSGFLFFLHEPDRKEEILKKLHVNNFYSPRISFGGATAEIMDFHQPKISQKTWSL